ncbi:MAG: pyruvate phosphate dikinase PEP/pyruvate-binding protein [Leptolyngbyaceae cyanobacterium RU_5_1]|nr:pyruvate phosphate dikinase PEP/pyruvate-binding protein [Leptolyngbyaceae cyanobacterium RU_5_1]
MTEVWGALIIFTVCPLLGGLPLISWITYALTRQRLTRVGTGNGSVSAAFYHGGRLVGILAVLSEALKGIAAVLIARYFFPTDAVWEIVALIALVMGRYWMSKGAGTTNVVWGYVVHDPRVAALVFLIGGISFTILRQRNQGKFGVLVLFPLMTALLNPDDGELIVAAIALAVLLGWIYTKVPDDLALNPQSAQTSSRSMFQFFRGDRALRSLDHPLDANKYGQKAATLSHLKRLGYPVPTGWVLAAGDDPQPLIDLLQPSPKHPLVIRSSAIGEDSESASAAGQYESVLSVTSREALLPAITRCFASYMRSSAVQYRRDRELPDTSMAVMVQQQIRGVFSGVAFSRDPVLRQGDAVVVEALPGNASQVVSGRVTPEAYRVWVDDGVLRSQTGSVRTSHSSNWRLPDDLDFQIEGTGAVPPRLIQQVAYLARQLEAQYQSIPQDIEWTYDGQTLWLLQARPITTLVPIWTRKIAAEVIPGLIRPLTWSINRPLTCGVWGDIFTLVLAKRARGLDFNDTATLHYSRAYFNASLLGQIFRRMGLPPESLEFLTRGARFSKPPLTSTLRNLPGLLRLLSREWNLEQDFRRDDRRLFSPTLTELAQRSPTTLSGSELLSRIDRILDCLKPATYYSILAPLSAAFRKAIAKVEDQQFDNSATPEVAALRSLQELALSARRLLEQQAEFEVLNAGQDNSKFKIQNSKLFSTLAKFSEGQALLTRFDQIVNYYGYLSEVGTDIAVPTWKEDPQPVQALFAQFCLNPPPSMPTPRQQNGKVRRLQNRFDLKGKVTEVYSRLLAELRWSFIALENLWLESGLLTEAGDIFFLEFDQIRQLVEQGEMGVQDWVAQRRSQLERDRQLETVPFLVYGDDPPVPALSQTWQASQQLHGIGASPGQAEGRVRVIKNLDNLPDVGRDTIVVVPYTDSGWAPLLARAGGLIAEVGGRLSHGAIVAREYRIPAVMDVHNATQLLHDGQLVRIDGQQGTVEIL